MAEWTVYHDLRRRVLFALREPITSYNPNHPDEHRIGNYPLVLWSGEIPAGVIRIDIEDSVAIFRRVAIRPELQRKGYGRQLLRLAEAFAKARACNRIESHVAARAIKFFERCGFECMGDQNESGDTVVMGKLVS